MFFFNIEEEKVRNVMNETGLEFINILGLFDQYDIKLDFNKQVNIYIGENGLGKTTILNCIYYILEKRFTKLAEVNFMSMQVKFATENFVHEITIFDIEKYNSRILGQRRYLDSEYFQHLLFDLTLKIRHSNDEIVGEEIEFATRKLAKLGDIPYSVAREQLLRFLRDGETSTVKPNDKGDRRKVERLSKSINENISQRIIYLPTYRRIENDFSKLLLNEEKFRNSDALIRFGMSDVQSSIDKILLQIKNESIDSFTKMTGVLLRQYSSQQNLSNDYDYVNYNEIELETIKIILDRLGDEIKNEDKQIINDLFVSEKIYLNRYSHLLDLIKKLIANYEVQRKYDDKIKNFADTCNKYLNGKQFYYNQSELSLKIQLVDENLKAIKTIDLTNLSSGEKQIVSLFSKFYLDSETDSIVIFDEPELSLSMKWQSMLLPDIIRSKNCQLLITVTHSPFIFENEFDSDAREMRASITQTKNRG